MQQDQPAAAPLPPPLPPSSSSTAIHDSSNSLLTNEQGHRDSSVTAHPQSTSNHVPHVVESTLSHNPDKGQDQNNLKENTDNTVPANTTTTTKTTTSPEPPTSATKVFFAPVAQSADTAQVPSPATLPEVTESGTRQEALAAGEGAAPTSSRLGSRFSVNLSGVGLPSMASNLGLTQANGERAADMAQDLKKNVVNMWHAWFPTPPPTSSLSSSTETPTTTATLDSAKAFLQSPNSGSQSLSIHSQQQGRPAKSQRLTNSYTLGSKAGSEGFMSLGGNRSPPLSQQQQSVSPLRGYSLDIPDRKSAPTSPVPSLGRGGKDTSIRIVHEANDPIASRSSTCVPPPSNLSNEPIYLMGKLYPPSPTQWTDFQRDFTSGLIWCTYRHSYPPIKPSTFTTDVGWGCMLRSGQGLLANALAIQFMGRGNSSLVNLVHISKE